MGWSATFNAEKIERERETLRARRSEAEAEMEREIEAVRARYALTLRTLDEDLADLDRFERVAVRLAGTATMASTASGTLTQADASSSAPPLPTPSGHNPARSLAGEIAAVTPSQKQMVLDAVRFHGDAGAPRPQIVEFIKAKYGADVSPNNVTTALHRLKKDDGLVRSDGRLWFPAAPQQGALLEDAATSNNEKGNWRNDA